jgi:hypothetical protein
MILTSSKLDAVQVSEIVRRISEKMYGGNLYAVKCERISARRTRFTLKVRDSKEIGAHRSSSGRRTVSACWHAHRDVMHAIFYVDPSASLTSGLVRYEGLDSFLDRYLSTYHHNAGSMMSPVPYGSLCSCDADDRAVPTIPHTVEPSYRVSPMS